MRPRFRMPYSKDKQPDEFTRPPVPAWLVSLGQRYLKARKTERSSYRYWLKMYWATPPWLSDAQIESMRALYASARSNEQVDHIVPLKSPLVCGLHVPWNLQKLSVKENLCKSNHEWPDSPFAIDDMFSAEQLTPHQQTLFD